MEVLTTTVLVERQEKEQKNVFMPPELKVALEAIVKEFGRQKGWAVYSAAVLQFLRVGPKERSRLIGEMVAADATNTVGKLVDDALRDPRFAELVHTQKAPPKSPSGPSEQEGDSRRSRAAKPR